MTLPECIGLVAPYYNLVGVVIVIALFIKLFSQKKKGLYLKPWYLLFTALMVYVVEETMTVLASAGIIENIPNLLFPLFEMLMITLFIYMLLLQKDYIKTIP